MTENEAIKELSYDSTAYGGRCTEGVRRVAIHALSEIQAYRAIGTVEEIKSYFEENRKAGYKHGYGDGYIKAIDEFKNKLLKCDCKDELRMMVPYEYIYKVAEEMEEGAE